MTQLSITLTGDPGELFRSVSDLLDSNNTLTANVPREIAPGATLTLLPMPENRSGMAFDSAPLMEFILRIGEEVATGVIAGYLYEKLSRRKDRVRLKVNQRITEMNEGSITRIIDEEIDYKRGE